jgi:hypothetical protein
MLRYEPEENAPASSAMVTDAPRVQAMLTAAPVNSMADRRQNSRQRIL